ncbi:amidase family protein [Natrinema marinum]|uniref:amidase family protein n=1 Tax=Natrinema marinum TaxID=2961598 RepID=UPI0020C88F5E|nr:amidase family protein [Natrinema marinum]
MAPTLSAIAAEWGIDLTAAERDDYRTLVDDMMAALSDIESMSPPRFDVLHGSPDRHDGRDAVTRPGADRDPYNAWLSRCRIDGAPDGPLEGYTLGIKDNVAVAGVPCTSGAKALEAFEPEIDATVVGRLLDAGATVLGKTNMDAFAMGDAGELQDYGPTLNPADEDRLAGGSSSGSAAAVAAGDCDAAIGTDQAGSVRTPAAWCGVVGYKPTYGLVPYTGVFGMDFGFDHVGGITRTVRDAGRILGVIAGEDRQNGCRLDSRQPRGVTPDDYVVAADRDVAGMTVGVLEAGFDWPQSEPRVDETVRQAIARLEDTGVDVVSVSVPGHRRAPSLVGVTAGIGAAITVRQGGVGTTTPGWHWTNGRAAVEAALEESPNMLSPAVVATLLFARECWETTGWSGYARAKNRVLALGREYDEKLDRCDALVLPTSPMTAVEHDPDADRVERVGRLSTLPVNTGIFNQTGHPAVSVPCGTVDGLPVGLQLVGRRFDEATLFRLAAAIEADFDGSAAHSENE